MTEGATPNRGLRRGSRRAGASAGVVVAACGLLACAAGAQPAAEPSRIAHLIDQLGAASRESRDTGSAAALDRAIEARSSLLAAAPDDERAAAWHADQAGDLLDRLAPDASDVFALLGVADQVQAARVRERTALALTHLDRAERLAAGLREEERRAAARGDTARVGVLEEVLRPIDGGMRGAFLRARASLLAASCETEPGSRARLATAAGAILAGLESAHAPTEALRRLHLGLAKWMLEREDARVVADASIVYDDWSAADLIRDIAPVSELLTQALRLAGQGGSEAGRSGGGAGPGGSVAEGGALIAGEARIALVVCARTEKELDEALAGLRGALAGEPFVRRTGGVDGALLVAAAEAAARRTIARPGGAEAERVARLREACAWYADVLARAAALDARGDRGVAGGQGDALRSVVIRRLGALLGDDAPVESLPAAAGLALGVRWGSSGSAPGGSAALRTKAEAVLRATASRADAGDAGVLALRELGVVLTQGEGVSRWIEGARALLDYAERAGAGRSNGGMGIGGVGRAEAVLGAAGAAERALASAEAEPAEQAAARETLVRALRAGLSLDAGLADIDQLRCRLAEVRLETPRAGERAQPITPDELEEVLADLGDVQGASRWKGTADRLGVLAAARALEGARGGPADLRVRAARVAAAWASSRGLPQAERLRLEWAEAMLDAGDPGALRVYSELARGLGARKSPDRDSSGEGARHENGGGVSGRRVLVGLGAAQRLSGDDEAAFATWKNLVERIEAETGGSDRPVGADATPETRSAGGTEPASTDGSNPAGSGQRSGGEVAGAASGGPGGRGREFWQAWAGMLEILAARNADGSRSGQIRLWVSRLEIIDPALGGGDEANRIRAVANLLGDGRARENPIER